MLKIAYFVHDLSDAAVQRRVTLLQWGGGEPVLMGFYRKAEPPAEVSGAKASPLGRTFDGQFIGRIKSVLQWCLKRAQLKAHIGPADVIIARNLEMLLLGWWLRGAYSPKIPLVYECLDIHTKMLGNGLPSQGLRALERFMLKDVHSVIVSSPAFTENYFKARQNFTGRVDLIENKTLETGEDEPRKHLRPLQTPPWVIGWFGVIRCQKSLTMLKTLVETVPNLQVLIAGKPAYTEFDDFDAQIAASPNIRFTGPYKLEDLPGLYAQVHLTWAIDYYEEGQNSAWLLPNRLYEGGICGSLPIALGDVETGRWLDARHAGVIITDPLADLPAFFNTLTPESYARLRDKALAIPSADLTLTHADAGLIVKALTD